MEYDRSNLGISTIEAAPSGLITDEPWDCYHLQSLLALKETYRENASFGFLLRHYWIPATVLRFRQSSRVTGPNGNVKRQELQIDRRMARCRSNECTWRESTTPLPTAKRNRAFSAGRVTITDTLCSYDCYDQTYVSAKPVLFELPTEEQKEEARRQALYSLPLLVPPGPVPIGYAWHGKVGDDYMNYRLETEQRVGETSVLIIRREGRFTRWLSKEARHPSNGRVTTPIVTERQGVTVFAQHRGVVLEDRYLDQIVDADGNLDFSKGMTKQVVIRLTRSSPATE